MAGKHRKDPEGDAGSRGTRASDSRSAHDGWNDDKREQNAKTPVSKAHVAKHSTDGWPVGKHNP